MERLYSSQKTYVNTESFSLKLILTLSLFIALFQISELKAQTLIISKTGSISASPGEIINYTIQYANTGLVTATDVEITDYLPDPASYTYVSSFPAGVYDAANNKISWTKTEISSLSSLQATRGEITVQLRAGNTAANTYYYVSTSPTIADNYAGIESVEVSTPIISNNVFTTIDQYCGLTFSPVEVGEVKSNGGSGTRYLVNVINQGNIYDKFTIDTLQIGHPDQDKILEISVYDLSGNPLTETGWLAPGESFYFYVIVYLPIPTSANTFNYVDIIGTSNVCPGTSESTTIKTKIHNPAPNKSLLYLSKLDGTDPIAAGDTLDYVIYIYNYSDVATVNLRVTETYDANVSFLSATPSPDSGDNIWFLPPLAGGDYTTIEVRVIVDTDVPNGTILTNHVLADADNAEESKAVVTTTMVESYPDLDIQKTANPTIVGPQDFITYTINYANLGNLTAQNVSIVDDYDENNLSISSPNGGIDNGNTLTFNLPDLAPGATGSLTYIAKTKTKSNYSGGITVVTNTAQIKTTTLEANLNNNIAIELISVALLPDLDITLAASAEPANVNLPVTFTITVRNLGNYHSENVLIQNILPAGLTFVSASDGGILNAGIISWPVLPLTHVVDVIERTFIAIPDCSAIPSVTNTASVANDLIETDYTNNTASLTSTIVSDFQFTNCPTDQSVAMDAGICGAVISFITPSAEDECEGTLPVIRTDASGLNSGDVFPEGTTTISYSATNSKGITLICSFDITVGPDTEGPVIHNVPADVILECSDCIQSFENNDFEVPAISGSWASILASDISGWETTAVDNRIEIQKSGGIDGVNSYSGNQHAELNGNNVGDFYQEFCTVPTTTVQISFAHHKRMAGINTSDDIMEVFSGSDLSNLISLGQFTATSTSGWTVHTVDFPIPPGQNSTVFVFRAIQGAPSNTTYGNLIDDINVITLFDATSVPYATDNCALESLSLYEEKIDGTCLNDYRVNRTWTAVDAAGNTTTATQSVIVGDVIGPDFSVPADITISCELDPTDLAITGNISNLTDNCDPAPDDFNYSDVVTPGSCGNNSTIERTWTLTDHCNNSTSKIQIITVEDTTPPVFNETLPADLIIECGGVVPAIETLTVSDNCGTATFTYLQTLMPGACTGSFTISRTWLAKDECGNTSTHTQNIEYGDTTPPTASNPLPITVQCGSVPAPDVLVVNDEADNCSAILVVAHVSDVSDGNTCPEIITRTYSVTDECANTLNVTQTITVGDTTPPTASNPLPITVQCGSVPAPDVLVVIDEADNCSTPVIAFVSDTSDGNSCPEIITRTYSVTDDCGNSINVAQTITVGDTTPPTASNPLPITVQCTNVPAADISVVTDEADNCTANPVVAFVSDVSDGNTCPEIITRTYSVTDDCGNSTTVTQTITIDDDIAPTFISLSSDLTVESDENGNTSDLNNWLNSNGGAMATDNCSNISWTNDFTALSDLCGITGAANVTFTATDECGNSSTTSAIFTIEDTTPPIIHGNASNKKVKCDGSGNNGERNQWLNLNGNGSVSGDVSKLRWSYEIISVSDLCGLTGEEEVLFTVTDECGNSTTTTAKFIIEDKTPPTIDTHAANHTVECDGSGNTVDLNNWLSSNAGAAATDDCSGVNWSNDFTSLSDLCGLTGNATVTFTATDDCGNSSTTSAKFTIEDTTPPTASNPLPITVQCDNVPVPDVLVVTDEADSCSSNLVVAFVSDASDGNTCPEIITRTYSVTDDCGNSVNVEQTITVGDTTSPTIDANASNLSVECDGSGNTADLNNWLSSNGGATASDNCSVVNWSNDFASVSDLCGLTGIANVTFKASDECGNSVTTTATFTIEDNTAPSIDTPASNLSVECDGGDNRAEFNAWIKANANASATDMCSGISWSSSIVSENDLCGDTKDILVEFVASDECGNSSTTSATFSIVDTTPPAWITPLNSLDRFIECSATDELNIALALSPSALDNCGGGNVEHQSEIISECSGTYTITKTWTAIDNCDNESLPFTQVITVEDKTPPTVSTPASNLSVECDGNGNIADLNNWLSSNAGATAFDNCVGVSWTNDFTSLSDLCGLTGQALVTFTAIDECGNFVSTAATFTIVDTTSPVIYTPASNLNAECDGNGNTDEFNTWLTSNGGASASDDCSSLSWSNNFTSLSDLCGLTGAASVIFTATDDCGNSSTTSATFAIVDTTPPSWETSQGSLDITLDCADADGLSAALTLSPASSDICGDPILSAPVEETIESTCPNSYTLQRTWQLSDDCGNASAPFIQKIIVSDNTSPQTSDLADTNLSCDDDNGMALALSLIPSFTDNCTPQADIQIVLISDQTVNSCENTYVRTRVWQGNDLCGNTAISQQRIFVEDTTAPTADPLPAIYSYCINDYPAPSISSVKNAIDNCSETVSITFITDLSDGHRCPETITRTYSLVDDCGNESFVNQTIRINDTIPPTADQPEALIFSREEDIPDPNINILKNVRDNCTEHPVVSIVNFKTESPSDTPQVTHVYLISDECSNTKSVLHNIFVINNPEANDDVYILEENSENNALPILINDLFGDDGPNETECLWLNSDHSPSYGEVKLNDNGTPFDAFDDFFVYTPDKYNLESDSFGYTIADKSGDEASAVVQISINPTPLHIPEAFSPNNDGINETFFIRGLEFYPNNSIVIYDKQGNMLYERSPYNNDWDGTNEFSSNPFEILPQATYFYILDLGIGERPIKGFVYINRYK